MRRFVAIGSGSFQKQETLKIDQFIIQKTGKQNPKVLFLPAAAKDDQGYGKRFKQYYRSLGCEVKQLRLWHTKLEKAQIQDCVLSCDILYLGGGNTTVLMQILKEKELLPILKLAYQNGIVCVGNSAGANVWFDYGFSDLYDDGSVYAYVEGMHVISGIFYPHANDVQSKSKHQIPPISKLREYTCFKGEALYFENEIMITHLR
ncbi:Type 1 glutamine amidotransferase-like domain-containing protein [Amedibacillus dolichus]|uniref:Type 1 glutamine amidotransferase-like domain-containing protein n=1 Tax=Amedibacillus dolichus TaxID=31971 RepID=UPI00242AFF3A|nr:Type 1 glutamine amidotransferase-like domain-containing protein [Amedibacillus dolichus]